MAFPMGSVASALKAGLDAVGSTEASVRVAVYVDASATRFLVETLRDMLVPETTGALVRVNRLEPDPVAPKPDTDVVIVITCGSDGLERSVQRLVVSGAPVCVVCESSVEVPFAGADTPMLGLVAATDPVHLEEALSRWILERTDKGSSFAANFPFMREAASDRVITQAALANMATGALFFIPGADYPVMALAQASMALELSRIFGYRLGPERGYEIAGTLAGGLALRALSRAICSRAPRASLVAKALIGGFGTYGMGRALAAVYDHGVDYTRINGALGSLASAARDMARGSGPDAHRARGGARATRDGREGCEGEVL